MNDAIYNTALEIKYNTSEDAIIDLWWDYGYLYQAVARRSVSFHGGSFDSSRLHWFASAMLTDDPTSSRNILNMLNCGTENKAVSLLSKHMPREEAVYILHDILSLSGRTEAMNYLSEYSLPEEIADKVFCEPREAVLVIGDELEKKFALMDFYASFDFRLNADKLETEDMEYGEAIAYLSEKHNMTAREAERRYNDVVMFDPGHIRSMPTISDPVPCQGDEVIACGNVIVNISSMEAVISGKCPTALLYYDGNITRVDYDDPEHDYSVIVKDNNAFLINSKFDGSVLTYLLYFRGAGMDDFELFHEENKPVEVYAYDIIQTLS
jgi:asparagine N-glycosylation enzyme membrane subunit Stt3